MIPFAEVLKTLQSHKLYEGEMVAYTLPIFMAGVYVLSLELFVELGARMSMLGPFSLGLWASTLLSWVSAHLMT